MTEEVWLVILPPLNTAFARDLGNEGQAGRRKSSQVLNS